jgi:hypothetical protein
MINNALNVQINMDTVMRMDGFILPSTTETMTKSSTKNYALLAVVHKSAEGIVPLRLDKIVASFVGFNSSWVLRRGGLSSK